MPVISLLGVHLEICIEQRASCCPHPHRAAAVVRDHPGVMVMVDHCGIPYERDTDSMKVWREGSDLYHDHVSTT